MSPTHDNRESYWWHRCTACEKPRAMVRKLDASGDDHWFHAPCWRAFYAWICGKAHSEEAWR